MRQNGNFSVVRPALRRTRPSRACRICGAVARLLGAGIVTLAIVYAPALLEAVTAWCVG